MVEIFMEVKIFLRGEVFSCRLGFFSWRVKVDKMSANDICMPPEHYIGSAETLSNMYSKRTIL